MALKKACCCLSARMGALLFSYLFLIGAGWNLLSLIFDFQNTTPKYREFLEDNSFLFYATIFLDSIQVVIFLANVLSISNNTPSVYFLNAAIIILPLSYFLGVYGVVQFAGEIDNLLDAAADEEYSKYEKLSPPHLYSHNRDEFRNIVKAQKYVVLKLLYFFTAVSLFIVTYAILVFHGYKTELKENPVGVVPVRPNIDDEAPNVPKMSASSAAYNLQMPPPQYSTQLPQCSTMVPQYFVELKKQ